MTMTSIRLERSKLDELKRRAIEENRSLASLMNRIIDEYLSGGDASLADARRAEAQKRAIRKWAGTFLGKGFDGRDHDEILYGRRK